MDFFIPNKIVFNLNNIDKSNFSSIIESEFKFDKIKKYHSYTLSFYGESTYKSSYSLRIIQYFNNKPPIINIINLNESYTCSSYYLEHISLCINSYNISDSDILNLEISEEYIDFSNSPNITSSKLNTFIDNIHSEFDNITFELTNSIKVASILDEFSFNCFKYDVNIINLSYTNALFELNEFKPDLLLVESAWKGHNDSWSCKLASDSDTVDTILSSIIDYCNSNNIPTVFWNKEGLLNFHYFKNCSTLFKFIFITDENLLPRYKSYTDNVYLFPFFAQPKIHNSVNKNQHKLGNVAFAGSWYGDKHLDRQVDMDIILKPSLKFNLDILDRNYKNKKYLEYIGFYWPKEYRNNILGSLPYNYINYIYKNYDLFLNINSVQNSEYMTSRRIYEILASKTSVISSYSLATYNIFNEYIYISTTPESTTSLIEDILCNTHISRKKAKYAQRFILENHTCQNRLEYMLDILKIKFDKYKCPSVCLLCFVFDESSLSNLYNIALSQTYSTIKYLILIPSSLSIDKSILNKLLTLNNLILDIFYITSDFTYIQIHDYIVKHYYSFDYYSFINPKFFYGANYIRDYVNTLKFIKSDTNVIGKNHIFIDIVENNLLTQQCDTYFDSYCKNIYIYTAFVSKNSLSIILKNFSFTSNNLIYTNDNLIIYSDDEFNFSTNLNLNKIVSV